MTLQGIVLESVEHGREVALTGVRQQHHNLLALVLRTLGHLDGSVEGSACRDTYQQTFALGNLTTRADGVVVLHVEHLVDDVAVVGLGKRSQGRFF